MTHIIGDFWIANVGTGYGFSDIGDGGNYYGWRHVWQDRHGLGDGYEHGQRDGNGWGVGVWATYNGDGTGGEQRLQEELTPF